MLSRLSRLPNGFVICASTLLCAVVVALQNAPQYAAKLELALSSAEVAAPELLRHGAQLLRADSLNAAELTGLSRLARLISAEECEPAVEATPPLTEPMPAETLATPPAAPEEAVAVAEPPAAPEPAEVEMPPAEPVETAAPVPELPQPAVKVPAAASSWWWALGQVREGGALPRPETRSAPLVSHVPAAEPLPEEPAPQAEPAAQETAAPAAPQEEPAPAPEEPQAKLIIPGNFDDPQIKPQPWPPRPESEQAAPLAAEPAVAPAEPRETPQTPPMRARILMVGDSLMEDLGPRTHKAFLKRKGLHFVISAKFSTGLCRPEIFNWPAHMREVVAKYPPDLVIFFIGANDGMPVREGRRNVQTGRPEWREAYMRKMDELISIAREAGAEIIWVEMPAVGGRYNRLLHETQIAQRTYCEERQLHTLRTDPLLSGEWGKFEPFGEYQGKQVRLRRKDLTHLSDLGNKKVLEHLMPLIEERLGAIYAAHPERHLTEEAAAKLRNVQAVYTCKYTPPAKKEPEQQPAPTAQPLR